MAAKNRILLDLIPEPLAIELHLFFPGELALGVALGLPFFDALVFSTRFWLFLGGIVDGQALVLLFQKLIGLACDTLDEIRSALAGQLLETGMQEERTSFRVCPRQNLSCCD